MKTRIIITLLSCFSTLGALAPKARACDPPTTGQIRQAEEDFEQLAKTTLKQLKRDLNGEYRGFVQLVEQFKIDLENGSFQTAAEAYFYARVLVNLYLLMLDDMMNQSVQALAGEGTILVDGLGVVPRGFQAGGGGTWDGFLKGVQKANDKIRKRIGKRMKGLAAALRAMFPPAPNPCPPEPFGNVFLFLVPKAWSPVAAAPGVPQLALPNVPFRLTSYAAGRFNDAAAINLIGQAQPGSSINVQVTGPNGFSSTQNVVAGPDGKWSADFADLPPGQNYGITATNGSTTISKTVITR